MRTGRAERNEEIRKEVRKNKSGKRRRVLTFLLLLIIILAAAIAGLVYYSYRQAEDSLAIEFTEESPVLEFGSAHTPMEYVKASEGDAAASSESLDTTVLGPGSVTYTVSKELFGGLLTPSKEFTLEYTVEDTVSPLILWNGSGSVIARGGEFDINDYIGYGDNADPVPELTVDGKVDTVKNGSYDLHVTVTDASGNSEECDTTIIVADSVPSYQDNTPRTDFKDFVKANRKDGLRYGIDVSFWHGDIDWGKVRKAGCDFAIIRIGYSENGKLEPDSKFEQNLKRVTEAGIPYGVYMYSYDSSVEQARSSAAAVASRLEELGAKPDLPVVFDWEDFGRFQNYSMSFTDLNSMYDVFSEELAGKGYDCMLYGSKNYLEKVWADTDTRPVWLAHYTDKTDYEGPYAIWQASCTGRINGIDGDVDMDIMYEND